MHPHYWASSNDSPKHQGCATFLQAHAARPRELRDILFRRAARGQVFAGRDVARQNLGRALSVPRKLKAPWPSQAQLTVSSGGRSILITCNLGSSQRRSSPLNSYRVSEAAAQQREELGFQAAARAPAVCPCRAVGAWRGRSWIAPIAALTLLFLVSCTTARGCQRVHPKAPCCWNLQLCFMPVSLKT